MRNYCFTSVSVSGSGADSVFLVMGFVFPFRRVVFLFRVLGFRFACMLLLRVLDFYFRVSSVCFVLRASRELSVFDIL